MTRVLAGAALIVGLAAPAASSTPSAPSAPSAPSVPSATQQGTLRDARIRIVVVGDTARIAARYRITDAGDTVRFHALRIGSQKLVFARPDDPRLRLDTLPGGLRLTAAGRGRALGLELRYAVTGDLTRIPLFVPEAASQPGESRLLILVEGVEARRTTAFPVPRFSREGNGPLRATPDHLPSLVAVVAPAGGLPVPAIAQWSVLLIALGGTAAWLLLQLGGRRRA